MFAAALFLLVLEAWLTQAAQDITLNGVLISPGYVISSQPTSLTIVSTHTQAVSSGSVVYTFNAAHAYFASSQFPTCSAILSSGSAIFGCSTSADGKTLTAALSSGSIPGGATLTLSLTSSLSTLPSSAGWLAIDDIQTNGGADTAGATAQVCRIVPTPTFTLTPAVYSVDAQPTSLAIQFVAPQAVAASTTGAIVLTTDKNVLLNGVSTGLTLAINGGATLSPTYSTSSATTLTINTGVTGIVANTVYDVTLGTALLATLPDATGAVGFSLALLTSMGSTPAFTTATGFTITYLLEVPTYNDEIAATPSLGGASGLVLDGNYAYIAARTGDSATVVDVSNPNSLTVTGTLADSTNLNGARGIDKSGTKLYITGFDGNSLAIVDVSTPATPSLSGQLIDAANLAAPTGVKVSGNWAFVADSSGLTVIDVTTASSPTFQTKLTDTTNMNGPAGIAISGTFAFVTGSLSHSLASVNIATAGSPAVVGQVIDATNLNTPAGVAVSGNNAYVAFASAGLTIVDVTNPATPSRTGTLSSATYMNGAYGVMVLGNYAYVASSTSHSLVVVDVSTPASPVLAVPKVDSSKLHTARGLAVDASGNAYVTASGYNALVSYMLGNIQNGAVSSLTTGNGQYGTNMQPTQMVLSFQPTRQVASGTVTITSSPAVFAADGAVAGSDYAVSNAGGSPTFSGAAISSSSTVLTLTMSGGTINTGSATTVTLSTGALGVLPAPGVVTFSIAANGNAAQTGITGFTVITSSATAITAISPTTATQADTITVTFTGASSGDLADFGYPDCTATTPSTNIGTGSASFAVPSALGSSTAYKVCYRASGFADSIAQTTSGVTLTSVSPTSTNAVNALSPTSGTEGASLPFTFTGASAGDLATFAASGACAAATPNVAIGSGSASMTVPSAGASTTDYVLCVRKTGGTDSIQQSNIVFTSAIATSATAITANTPTSATAGNSVTISFTGATAGDLAILTTAGNCASVTPSVAIGSGSGTFTIPAAGSTYKFCLRRSDGSDSVEQTTAGVQVVSVTPTSGTRITGMSVTVGTVGESVAITFTGALSGDLAALALNCASATPSVDIGSGSGSLTVPAAGALKLCLRKSGGTGSVEQTNAPTFTGIVATSATHVTMISPASGTTGDSVSISFTGASTGDLAIFTTSGNCGSVTPNVNIGSGSGTFTIPAVGSYVLCVRANGGIDSKEQTGITLGSVTATTATHITALDLAEVTVGVPTEITFTGAQTGDTAVFALTGDCGISTPNLDLTGGSAIVTIASANDFKLCVRKAGGSDLVEQTTAGVGLHTHHLGVAGHDPIARFGDRVVEFELPPGQLSPLLQTPDMKLHGETFEGGGSWEQWFNKMVLTSPDGDRWLQVSIKKNLLSFNRSKSPAGSFESLEVQLGHGNISNPWATTELTETDTQIPYGFLGLHVRFRKMERHWKNGVQFPTIGQASRECMDVAGEVIHFYICSAPANEYLGAWQRYLSIQYAHLDIAVLEVTNSSAVEGLFPELWGMRPLSASSKSVIKTTESKGSVRSKEETIPSECGTARS
eukprot:TRINITY_DN27262_c0_g2_i1.p1 TRINITY_DN27262_c0_g2~~TRINITY_DN27262_c0_g2_i1.p1  ORF type:complete len:1548 (+),score=197.19 TRINITY_DN27262_c0_g2_i1:171-4814(+)